MGICKSFWPQLFAHGETQIALRLEPLNWQAAIARVVPENWPATWIIAMKLFGD